MQGELRHGLNAAGLLTDREVISQVLQPIEAPGYRQLGAVPQVQGLVILPVENLRKMCRCIVFIFHN